MTTLKRCVIYTRKSSEQGLEQDFNSLDAQREAATAYIASQRHERWKLVGGAYDDAGWSGGNMDRPALRRLLADIQAKRIDIVVVYKVDRLTRSLSDFAKLVEVFDAHGVSFVSVTQQFNTTSSMGRLTLNVLLSFAQFEREVTGERIRDKIAASKKKGMWMGGNPPTGYDVTDKKLIANKSEADTIRLIFQRYLELGCVRKLQADLAQRRILSKGWISTRGNAKGGKPFTRGNLYLLLRNRTYIGEIAHRGQVHAGAHEAILDREIWDQVQALLDSNRVRHHRREGAQRRSLLKARIFDVMGVPLSPSHANKGGKQYLYYVSNSANGDDAGGRPALRLPAAEIEQTVLDRLDRFLCDPIMLTEKLGVGHEHLDRIATHAEAIRRRLQRPSTDRDDITRQLLDRLVVDRDRAQLHWSRAALHRLLLEIELTSDDQPNLIEDIAIKVKRQGQGKRIFLPVGEQESAPNQTLIKAVVRAHAWRRMLESEDGLSVRELAARQSLNHRYINRLLPLAWLAPDVVDAILDGAQLPEVSLDQLTAEFPIEWSEQRRLLALGSRH
jgi:site-specific DNA recombinase